MNAAQLRPGQEMMMSNKIYEIERYLNGEIQLVETKTKRATQIEQQQLLGKIATGEVKFVAQTSPYIPEHLADKKNKRIAALLEFYPEKLSNEMKIRRTFIEAYFKSYGDRRSQTVIRLSLLEFWKLEWGNYPSPSSVARWIKRYVEGGRDIRALGSAHFLKGNRSQRYDVQIVELCQLAIKKVYLRLERGSINATWIEAKRQVINENFLRPEGSKLRLPKVSFITSLIKDLPAYDVCVSRYGRSVAETKFRNAVNSAPVSKPLERVEVDHTQLDIVLVDPFTGMVFERPWITLIIEVYSRCILGFSLSYDPPSHMTVARALKMALLPKANIHERWPLVKGEWPMFGLMQDLVADNGFEFHGTSLEDACFMLGINLSYCPRKKGWWKAVIERAIGTLNRNVTDGLPGRTFSSIKEKADYQPSKNAILTLDAMEEIIAKWIVDIYHETVHDTLGRKPSSVWKEDVSLEDIPIITNVEELDAVLGVFAKRKLTHKGIEINNLRYNNDELGILKQKFRDKMDVAVKWDPENMGHIYVLPEDGSIIRVAVVPRFTDYAEGITLYQHNHYLAIASEDYDEQNDEEALFKAKAETQDFIQNESKAIKKNKKLYKKLRNQTLRNKPKPEVQYENGLNILPIIDEAIFANSSFVPKFEVKQSNRKVK